MKDVLIDEVVASRVAWGRLYTCSFQIIGTGVAPQTTLRLCGGGAPRNVSWSKHHRPAPRMSQRFGERYDAASHRHLEKTNDPNRNRRMNTRVLCRSLDHESSFVVASLRYGLGRLTSVPTPLLLSEAAVPTQAIALTVPFKNPSCDRVGSNSAPRLMCPDLYVPVEITPTIGIAEVMFAVYHHR